MNYPNYREEKFTGGEVTAAACRAGAAGRRGIDTLKKENAVCVETAVRAENLVVAL